MASHSPRLSLPLLSAGQAQKETTHNEALTLIDAATAPLVEDIGTNAPPVSPVIGQCWIVGTAPTGAWTGQGDALAQWTEGGWRFVDLPQGATVVRRTDDGRWHRFSDGWHAPQSIAAPTGGATVDAECRASLAALLNALMVIGFIDD